MASRDAQYVYFAGPTTEPTVKIGVSMRPEDRIKSIRAPWPLTIHATSRAYQRSGYMLAPDVGFHRVLAASRVCAAVDGTPLEGREWFRLTDEVRRAMERVADGEIVDERGRWTTPEEDIVRQAAEQYAVYLQEKRRSARDRAMAVAMVAGIDVHAVARAAGAKEGGEWHWRNYGELTDDHAAPVAALLGVPVSWLVGDPTHATATISFSEAAE